MLEFIDMEHSPKNILIRAVKGTVTEKRKQDALKEVQELIETFGLRPTLYELLYEEKRNE